MADSTFGDFLMGASPVVREEVQSRTMRRRSTNINVQKSLDLLEKAVSTPNPLLRSARKTPLKHSSYTPQSIKSSSRLDGSAIGGHMTPGSISMVTPSRNVTFKDTTDYTLAITPSRASQLHYESGNLGDLTTTNVGLLLEEDPELAAASGLYGDFHQCFMTDEHVFEKVNAYECLCDDQTKVLKTLIKKTRPGQNQFSQTLDMCGFLDHEKNTWRLIGSLYRDRLDIQQNGDEDSMMVDVLDKHVSEKQTVSRLYETDSTVRQTQLVIDWLEKTASEQMENYYDKVEFFTDQAGAWENTLHLLQQKSGGVPLGMDRATVNELDPDAPVRQKVPLADLDRDDDTRLLKYLLACVRAGQLDEAQRLCVKCGQAWRAATLEGWRLFHDPNYESLGRGCEVAGIEGNSYRDIWKSVCWKMAEEDQFHLYERALYAALSGNLKELLPACQSWEDHLWAFLKVMIDRRVEQEIRLHSSSDRPLENLPPIYWEKMLTLDAVFQEIQASPSETIKKESRERFHVIQKYIILGDTDGLVEEMYEWTRDREQPAPCHMTRFMAHVILFFRVIGQATKEELCAAILESYVQHLIDDKQIDLIASYVATLPQARQVEWYARFLEEITRKEERERCLKLAEDAGLDIHQITKTVVENIRVQDKGEFSSDLQGALETATSKDDIKVIEAIDWLVFDPAQRSEAMRQANAVMRAFLGHRKHAAARDVFNKIPQDSIHVIAEQNKKQIGTPQLSVEDDNTIKEYLCIRAYLDAHDSFNDWFEHYMNAKPAKPEIPAGANFTERVAFELREKQYEGDLQRWQHSLLLQTKHTEERIYNVLLFVGGWMNDATPVGTEDDQARTHQMALLRKLCLPTMCFLLHKVLHTTEQYKKCLQLADLIASEQHQLFLVFNKDELQKLLQKLRESSLALLDKNMDPLGYPLL